MTFVFAVRIVQLHPDLADVFALPIQPKHLVTELPNASRKTIEFALIPIVNFFHLLLHVLEVWGHVVLHPLRKRLVHVIDRTQIPLILPSLYFYETIVVTRLHYGVVHREQLVEVDVGDVLRKSVLAQTNDPLHPFQIVRLTAKFLQSLLSEVQVNVQILRVVDIVCGVVNAVVVCGVVDVVVYCGSVDHLRCIRLR